MFRNQKYKSYSILITCILLSLHQISLAQFPFRKKELVSGWIITLNNDTLKGRIDSKSELDMQYRIDFYSENNIKKVYYSKQIKGYSIIQKDDTIYYESFKYGKPFYFLNRNFFLKKIVDGKTTLYLYKEVGYTFWGLGKIVYYYYFLKKNGKWVNTRPITAYNVNQQMKRYLIDCDSILKELENKNIFIDELPKLIQKYNETCPL